MAVTFNAEFKTKVEKLIIQASLEVSTACLKDGSLDEFVFYDETSEHGKTKVKEVYEKIMSHYEDFENDSKLVSILKDITNHMIANHTGMLHTLTSVVRFSSNYLYRAMNDYCREHLERTGMWLIELNHDERSYLEGLVGDMKLRYEQPNKYADYLGKSELLETMVNNARKFAQYKGTIYMYDEFKKVADINKIIEILK